jgi:hypothetical protein
MRRLLRRAPGLLLAGTLLSARAADPAGQDQLRDELRRARQEIQALREENARLRGAAPAAPAAPPAVAAPGLPAAPAAGTPVTIVALAPLAEGEGVTLDRLVADYRQSALAADARYQGRRFRLAGTVDGFKKPFVGAVWGVTLRSGDAFGRVQADVGFPGISDFRLAAGDTELWGRRPFRAETLLARVGGELTLEGVCEGLDDGVIRFKKARPAAP